MSKRARVRRCRSCRLPFAPVGTITHNGRGLCSCCHHRHRVRGTLDRFPRATIPAAELVADANILRARTGAPWREIAAQLGVSPAALERARLRVAARGRAA